MELPQYHIRPIAGHDEERVYAFFQQLSDQSRALFQPHPFTRETARHLTGPDLADANTNRFLVGIHGDGEETMIGYLFFWDWSTSVPWFGIAVADSWQGQGVGSEMMAFAIELARSRGKGGILLTTHVTNDRGQALYRKCGFEAIGISHTGEHLMIRRL